MPVPSVFWGSGENIRKMKKIAILIIFAIAAGALWGCSRSQNIPRGELKEIFKDAFLVNAYYQSNPEMARAMLIDSLDIYRPILKRHGYTLRDLEYTIQQISKQKSRNLSDIIELSIEELKRESGWLDERVAVLDSVDARAGRAYMKTILFKDRITVKEIKDTAKLRINVPLTEGIYELGFSYLVDSLEQNGGIRVTATILDTLGRQRNAFSQFLTKNKRNTLTPQRFETTAVDTSLVLMLGNYPKNMGRPNLTIDSLRIVRFPPREVAVDSIIKEFYELDFSRY